MGYTIDRYLFNELIGVYLMFGCSSRNGWEARHLCREPLEHWWLTNNETWTLLLIVRLEKQEHCSC